MLNDIASFFEAEPDHDVAVEGIVNHVRRFWDLRMRRKLIAHLSHEHADLKETARAAVERLIRERTVV